MIKKRLIGLAALVLAVAGPVAHAGPAPTDGVHDMRGHFAMFTRTIVDPGIRPGTLDITSQVGPVLTGRANLTGRSVPVAGTVARGGAVTLSGLDRLSLLTIRARIPDLAAGIEDPGILEGRFQLSSLTGTRTEGDLVAVHQVPVSGAPSIGGDWAGVMIQDVNDRRAPVRASFAQTPTGALTGRMAIGWDNPELRIDLTMAGQVAVDNPDLRPGYLLIGASNDVLATAILQPASIDNPELRGPVRLLSADGTVTQATLQLDQATR